MRRGVNNLVCLDWRRVSKRTTSKRLPTLDELLETEHRLRAELEKVRERIVYLASAHVKQLTEVIRLRRSGLSTRERQVLALIRAGKQNKEIACELNIAVQTVKYHVNSLLKKHGVENRHEL